MLSLAMIPLVALVMLVFMAITTKNRYNLATENIRSQLEQQREKVLAEDQQNDRNLVMGIAGDQTPLGKLLGDYHKNRGALLPGVNINPPYAWTYEHLTDYFQHQFYSSQAKHARRELFRAAVFTLFVLAIAGGLALSWYHFHSAPSAADTLPVPTVQPVVDPFADFDNAPDNKP